MLSPHFKLAIEFPEDRAEDATLVIYYWSITQDKWVKMYDWTPPYACAEGKISVTDKRGKHIFTHRYERNDT